MANIQPVDDRVARGNRFPSRKMTLDPTAKEGTRPSHIQERGCASNDSANRVVVVLLAERSYESTDSYLLLTMPCDRRREKHATVV